MHVFCTIVKVTEAVTSAGMTQVVERVVVDTVTVTATKEVFDDQDLAPPAPPKKRLLETDLEVRRV